MTEPKWNFDGMQPHAAPFEPKPGCGCSYCGPLQTELTRRYAKLETANQQMQEALTAIRLTASSMIELCDVELL